MSDVDELRYAVHTLDRELRAHRRIGELNQTQYAILGGLERHGRATPAELADAHRVRSQTLTPALNALADAGLVRRERDEADRRRLFVELTDEGRQVVDADRRARSDWLEAAMRERLTPLERDVLLLAAPVLAKLVGG